MKVTAGGSVSVFERDGQYQFYADRMLPEGVGELSLAYEQLKAKLEAEGLFDMARKKRLPLLAKKIGIVTSATGAVLRDILKVGKRRNPNAEFILCPVQVQGDKASPQIAEAIRMFNEEYPVDVLIVGRGGGSMEDLWPFNEELTVRAVSSSKIPVVSAVGHETDFTLTDFAADMRAATPSHAAELTVLDYAEWQMQISAQQNRLLQAVRRSLREKETAYRQYSAEKMMNRLTVSVERKGQMVDFLREQLVKRAEKALTEKQHRFTLAEKRLRMLDPEEAVRRGYSMLTDEDGELVRQVAQVEDGQTVYAKLEDGRLSLKVVEREIQR
jgi:exodeoxyribonuclease VII large subunit